MTTQELSPRDLERIDRAAYTRAEHALRTLKMEAEAERVRMLAAQQELALAVAVLTDSLERVLAASDDWDRIQAPDEDLEPDDVGLITASDYDVRWHGPAVYDPTTADWEPTLGWPESETQLDLRRGSPLGGVLLQDGEAEPSLGSFGGTAAGWIGQGQWGGAGCSVWGGDLEDEHDGREEDDPAEDGGDCEPDSRDLPLAAWRAA